MSFDIEGVSESEMIERMSYGDKKTQREAIMALEAFAKTQPQVDVDVEQLAFGGVYVRAATAKAGTLLTGAIYKFDHIEIMTKGSLITTCDYGKARKLEGFNLMAAISGKKRCAYIIEDTTWLTVHMIGNASTSLDCEAIQDSITTETFEGLTDFYTEVNKADFDNFLIEIGVNADQVRYEAENEDDQTGAYDVADFSLYIDDSPIEGFGLFAEKVFYPGDDIMPARVDGLRTQAGRYINHALRPNAEFVIDGDYIVCRAIDEINPGDEITVNYRQVVQMRALKGDLCQV